jgi:putative ABC transport system permease protein
VIRFLLKGILHDRHRSMLPLIVISLGVALTVLGYAWLTGVLGESIAMSAHFSTGHLKVMTRAYADDQGQMPVDLALTGADELIDSLTAAMPGIDWVPRIRFSGLIDFPDEAGNTCAQGPATGYAIDLFTPRSQEAARFNLARSIVSGRLPTSSEEALLTHDFAEKFGIKPGDRLTFFGNTMEGSMAFRNFIVAGTVRFGTQALDHGAIIVDLAAARQALGMQDAAAEILGFFRNGRYNQKRAEALAAGFNGQKQGAADEFSPVMVTMRDQVGMAQLLNYTNVIGTILITAFVLAMSVVLWNTGLIGGLRRYGEFGVRLALGEEKGHIYRTLLYEALLIGMIGSAIGTIIGLGLAWYMQVVGLDIGYATKASTMMMPSVVRAQITATAFWIGFVPGLFSMVLGNALSGLGIYKRNTAQLFKELEA